ncbi:hypothetical protein [Fluviispira sanaruensis]|nr:hypothetical protein [Fluviispira sanaruensis]
MKTKKKNVAEKNLTVLNDLKELFKSLTDQNAIIGRDDERIVIDLSKAWFLKDKDISEIYNKSVLIAKNGAMSIFQDFEINREINIMMLNISYSIIENNENYKNFHYFNEIRDLIYSIPIMTQKQREYYKNNHDNLISKLFEITDKDRKNIRESLFGLSDNSSKHH